MFMTHPQHPADAAASIGSLKASLTKPDVKNEDPEESRLRVLHDLWTKRIALRAKKQGFRWNDIQKVDATPQDFSPRR
jgi:hypothetical protein